jgi:NAD dependent epimerase/dehydratase
VPGTVSRLAGRRVLVTGAGGFIGSHVVEALVGERARVRAFVRYDSRGSRGWLDTIAADRLSDVEVFAGDIRDAPTVDRAVTGCEVVLHLASLIAIPYSYLAPEAYIATNVVGTQHVLDACRRHDVARVVHTSTSEVYGSAQRVPIDEGHPLHPQSPYAASKASADLLALSYHASFGTPVVVLRPFNTYGPRQSLRAIIPTIAAQLLAGGPVRLGATTPTRDFAYVTDTADGFVRAASSDGVGIVIQLGTGRETSIADLARAVADVVGAPLKIETDDERVRPSTSEVMRLVSDASRAREVLGWSPAVTLAEGLRKTVDWLRGDSSVARAREYVR